jgi:hypothetical protein
MSHFSELMHAAKHGPAVSVIPVFMPQNPLLNNLFVFFHLFIISTNNLKFYMLSSTLEQCIITEKLSQQKGYFLHIFGIVWQDHKLKNNFLYS